jgi:hypothetical protein
MASLLPKDSGARNQHMDSGFMRAQKVPSVEQIYHHASVTDKG